MKVINVFIPPFFFSSKLNKYEEATVNLKKCELAHQKSKDLISKIKIRLIVTLKTLLGPALQKKIFFKHCFVSFTSYSRLP